MSARFIVMWETPSDPEAFDRHYREVHIPLGRRIPGLRRYTLGSDLLGVRGEPPYYRVAQLEWDSLEALRSAFASPEGQVVAEDVENLEKYAGVSSFIITTEEELLQDL